MVEYINRKSIVGTLNRAAMFSDKSINETKVTTGIKIINTI